MDYFQSNNPESKIVKTPRVSCGASPSRWAAGLLTPAQWPLGEASGGGEGQGYVLRPAGCVWSQVGLGWRWWEASRSKEIVRT